MMPLRRGKSEMAAEAASPDVWVNVGGVIAAVIFGVAGYFEPKLLNKTPAKVGPVIAGIGLALGDREQSERLIEAAQRCAAALEQLADKRQSEIDEKLQELLERIRTSRRRGEGD